MEVEVNGYRYTWIEDWARVPEAPGPVRNGRTHGVAVTADGTIIVFHQANPAVVLYDAGGRIRNLWGDRFPGAHGLTLVDEDGEDRLWLTDEKTGSVVKATVDGRLLAEIERAPHPAYADEPYAPTWVAVNETSRGGNGDVWVADGYGAGLVHRYDIHGEYVSTLTGEEGAGRFDCPHGLYFRHRDGSHELIVADRGNRRFQVFDDEGRFVRSFGEGVLHLPCYCFELDDVLVVPELNARLTFLDDRDELIGYLGRNEAVCEREDWPDVPSSERHVGAFNSPHSAAADAEGNLYAVEWMVGGRITKLAVA